MSIFANKTLMITGGTGSFGNAVLNRFLDTDIQEIRIFSRDEKKQDDMRHEFQAKMPEAAGKIKFFIGDVRDLASVKNAMHGVDYIFHAAALKQVPSCEFFPMEAVKTNVFGTDNVLTAAIDAGVKAVICLSTDKAAYPVNAMGTSKAMMEKVIVAKSRTVSPEKTKICCTLRKRHVLPGQRHPAVDRSDQGGQPHHHHRAEHDPVHYVSGRSGGLGAVCFPERRQRGHSGAEGSGVYH